MTINRWIGPLQDPVTWYWINYTGTQIMQWDFQNKGTLTSPAWLSFVLEVPLRHLRPSVIYYVPCDRILQRAYSYTDYNLQHLLCLYCSQFLRSANKKCLELWIIINYLGISILVAGRVIVDELIFIRINPPHSQFDNTQEPIHSFNSQQIILGRMGGNLHDLVYSGNGISSSNHKYSHTIRF